MSINIRRGYLGTGTKVHSFSYDYRRRLWFPACRSTDLLFIGQTLEDLEETQRPLDCLRCAKALGTIANYPGPRARRDLMEIEHLIGSTSKTPTNGNRC